MFTEESVIKYLTKKRINCEIDEDGDVNLVLRTRNEKIDVKFLLNIDYSDLTFISVPFSMKKRDMETMYFINELNSSFDQCKFVLLDDNSVMMSHHVMAIDVDEPGYVLNVCNELSNTVDLVIPALKRFNADNKSVASVIEQAEIGDIIKFGKYFQANDNKKTDIEWVVLDSNKDSILVLSKYALIGMELDNNHSYSWVHCHLRKWLNEMFLKVAFTSEERSHMIPQTHGDSYGYHSKDKVFLLDRWECENYMFNSKDRMCKYTTYAKNNGLSYESNGYCSWWLRNEVLASYHQAVGDSGYIGSRRTNCTLGVRPALYLSKKTMQADEEYTDDYIEERNVKDFGSVNNSV